MVVWVYGMLLLSAKCSRPLGSWEKHRRKGDLKDQSRLHQFGKQVLPGIFLGYALYARWIWKGLSPQTKWWMTEEPATTWSIEENYLHRHHVEPRVQRFVPREDSQHHCDTLTWSGQHLRPWMCCKKAVMIIIWNIDANRNHRPVSRSSPYWMRNLLTDICGVESGLQTFKQPKGLITCGQIFGPVKSSSTKGTAAMGCRETAAGQSATVERHPVYLIRMVGSSRKPIKKRKGKVGTFNGSRHALQAGDVLAQGKWWRIPRNPKNQKQKDQEDPLLRRSSTHWVMRILCTSSFLCSKRWKSRMRKQQCTKNGRSSKKCQFGKWSKVESKTEVILEAQREQRTVHFASLMDICHLKNAELEPKYQKIQRPGCTPRWHRKRRLRQLRCIHRTRFVCISNDGRKSNGCHCTATRFCRTTSRRSISLHSRKNERRSKMTTKSKVTKSRYLHSFSQKSWCDIGHPVVPPEHSLCGHTTCWIVVGKTIWKSSFWD